MSDFISGLALLQKRKTSPMLCGDLMEAPESYIQEAALFHRFSEAAYTVCCANFLCLIKC